MTGKCSPIKLEHGLTGSVKRRMEAIEKYMRQAWYARICRDSSKNVPNFSGASGEDYR
jgi:hypothetical protein